jgi:hypothetical protein
MKLLGAIMDNTEIDKESLCDLVGDFSWDYGCTFFIETEKGNFVWSDPEYGGNNEIKAFDGSFKCALRKWHLPCMRDKGTHRIKDYCGDFIWKPIRS